MKRDQLNVYIRYRMNLKFVTNKLVRPKGCGIGKKPTFKNVNLYLEIKKNCS